MVRALKIVFWLTVTMLWSIIEMFYDIFAGSPSKVGRYLIKRLDNLF